MNLLCPICDKPLKEAFKFFRCDEDHLYLDPRLGVYGDDYLVLYKLRARTDVGEKIYDARWSFIEKHVQSLSAKTLLDFGCGSNGFSRSANKCRCTYSYDPICQPDHDFLQNRIDVLTLWDSIEHMGLLETIPLIGAEYIFVTVPIIDDVSDILQWKHYKPYEHIWYFSSKAIVKLFKKWNYRLVERCDIEAKLRSKDIASFCFVNLTC